MNHSYDRGGMENKIKHLEMIENVIERMGNNSFQLKGWAVTLVSIIGALAARETDKRFFLIAFVPLIAFWAIDSFYLQTERKYKELYKKVQFKKKEEIVVNDVDEKVDEKTIKEYGYNKEDIDFDMDTSYIKTENTHMSYWNCVWSKTESFFYGSIIAAVLILAFILKVW